MNKHLLDTRLQVSVYFLDFESGKGKIDPKAHELVVRLVERELLTDPSCADLNCMYVDWGERGLIFWETDMAQLDLMIQFKILRNNKFVGSISLPFRDILFLGRESKQWLTIFDTLDDDIFDGQLGEDDGETPRVRLGFSVKAAPEGDAEDSSQGEDTQQEISMTRLEDKEHSGGKSRSEPRGVNIAPVQQEANSALKMNISNNQHPLPPFELDLRPDPKPLSRKELLSNASSQAAKIPNPLSKSNQQPLATIGAESQYQSVQNNANSKQHPTSTQHSAAPSHHQSTHQQSNPNFHKADNPKQDSQRHDQPKQESHKQEVYKQEPHKHDSHKNDSHKQEPNRQDTHKQEQHKPEPHKHESHRQDSHKPAPHYTQEIHHGHHHPHPSQDK